MSTTPLFKISVIIFLVQAIRLCFVNNYLDYIVITISTRCSIDAEISIYFVLSSSFRV